jgi:hypothetical protein
VRLNECAAAARCKRFGDRVKRRLGIFDNQQPRSFERDKALTNLQPDGAATACNNNGFAAHQPLELGVINLLAGAEQQILDLNAGKALNVSPKQYPAAEKIRIVRDGLRGSTALRSCVGAKALP